MLSKARSANLNTYSYTYPLSAIVGQEDLIQALILIAVEPSMGGLLISGEKGCAKSTASRALANLLPEKAVNTDCKHACDGHEPIAGCLADHSQPLTNRRAPFINLPIGTSEDRLTGSIDLDSILRTGSKALQPGLLAAADGGILYIDEVNLLADHLTDLLLDCASMGRVFLEKDGFSLSYKSQFSLVGTMNDEEGQLRPQILDRFGLSIRVKAPGSAEERAEVIDRRLNFEAAPEKFASKYEADEQHLRAKIIEAKANLASVPITRECRIFIAQLCLESKIQSLRTDIVTAKAARALAVLDSRSVITSDDILKACTFTLPHRQKNKEGTNANNKSAERDKSKISFSAPDQSSKEQNARDQTTHDQTKQSETHSGNTAPDYSPDLSKKGDTKEGEQKDSQQQRSTVYLSQTEPDCTSKIALLSKDGGLVGKRSSSTSSEKGTVIGSFKSETPTSLAVLPSILQAAQRAPGTKIALIKEDLHQQKFCRTTQSLIILAVDCSGSLGAKERALAVKEAALALLNDAYRKRDMVSIVTFNNDSANVVVEPTRSSADIKDKLQNVSSGGKTPLADGLSVSLKLALNARRLHKIVPLVVVISDGKANVSGKEGGDPWAESLSIAEQFNQLAIPCLMIDTEEGSYLMERMKVLSTAANGEYLKLRQVTGENLTIKIKERLLTGKN